MRQDLELVGADREFTFHCIRDQRIAEAGERGDDPASIYAGAGHAYGSHAKSYRATNAPWTLGGAGYGRDPELMAAHVEALYQELGGSVSDIVTMLYTQWRPELLQLESDTAAANGVAGERMRTWLHTVRAARQRILLMVVQMPSLFLIAFSGYAWQVRHCIGVWVASTAARPRDRFNYILAEALTKGQIISESFSVHLTAVFASSQYAGLAAVVRRFEDAEIALGDLAHRPASERRTRLQIGTLEQQVAAIPQQVADRVVPRFEQTESALTEIEDLEADRRCQNNVATENITTVVTTAVATTTAITATLTHTQC